VSGVSVTISERYNCVIPGKASGNSSVRSSIALFYWHGNSNGRGKGTQREGLDREFHRGVV